MRYDIYGNVPHIFSLEKWLKRKLCNFFRTCEKKCLPLRAEGGQGRRWNRFTVRPFTEGTRNGKCMKWMFAGFSEKNLRPTNMDSLFVEERRIEEKAALLAVVCDGVGSRADGAFASAYATESLASWFYAQTSAGQLALSLRERVLRINREILIHAEQRGLATASTLAALLLVEDRYSTVHAGDSRIYAVAEAQTAQLTRDDAAADGKLEQYLGRADGLQLQYSEADTSGQSFLLCTDGFYRKMPQEMLRQAAQAKTRAELDALLRSMCKTVQQRGERDNISAVLIKTKG